MRSTLARSSMFLMIAALAPHLGAQSLTTTFASDNGRSSPDPGNFFDVTVTNPNGLKIIAFDVNVIGTAGVPVQIDVYVTPTTYVGNDTNPAVWTQVGTGRGIAAGRDVPTPIDVDDFYLAPGSYGMYIHFPISGVAYTNGTGTNQNYSNADLALQLGIGRSTLFGGTLFNPRVWNGTIHYFAGQATYGRFGQGCADAMGNVPDLHVAGTALPVLGQTFAVEVTNLDPLANVLLINGTSKTTWSGIPLPFDLGLLGMTGCDLLVEVLFTLSIPNVAGTATLAATIPNFPNTIGVAIYQQALVTAPGANTLGLIVSNGGEGCLGM